MRRLVRKVIPSMFHRRLALQLLVVAGLTGLLAVRLAQLTLVEGDDRREAAESRLIRREWTPTIRGRVLDRRGRVLAMDRPAYSVAVDFGVLSGAWAERRGRIMASRVHGEAWAEADGAAREALAAPFRERYAGHVSRMFDRIAEATGTERGVLDRRIGRILDRVGSMREAVAEARFDDLIRSHLSGGRGLTDEDEARLLRAARTPIAEERRAHVLVEDVPDDAAFALRRLSTRSVPVFTDLELGLEDPRDAYADLFPGFEVRDTTDRVRPFDSVDVSVDRSTLPGPLRGEGFEPVTVTGLGWHTLGTLRTRIYLEDQQRREAALEADPGLRVASTTESGVDRGRYVEGDAVGQRGIERTHEHELRGLRGLRSVRLDTGEVEEHPPAPGSDIRLTIDAMLQARVRAAIDPRLGLARVQPWHGNEGVAEGETLAGAAVVLDVHTGHVLAMVSTPSPVDETRWLADGRTPEYADFLDPYVNRAIAVPYPPGSIVKPLMLSEAVARGHHRLGAGVVCTGHLLEDRTDVYRCWVYKRYGLTHSPTGEPVRASESIKVSCNIFYYTLGRRMGPGVIARAYGDLGVGDGFGLGIGREWPGKVGRVDGAGDGSDLGISDAILMAMGQGPVTWTPMHAANAYATLARGGAWIPPRIVDDGKPALAERMISLDPGAVDAALKGLKAAVNDRDGTGSTIGLPEGREAIFNAPGVDLWGKTGTAQAPSLRHDPDGDGPAGARVVRSGDHAWFVVLAGARGAGPRYAIAVLVEYGGSGGRAAGPIANQVVHALSAEGYLPGGGGSVVRGGGS